MKKIICILSAAAISMSAFTAPVFAADFPDMPADHWAYSYVMQLADDGTVNGDESGHFNPTSQVTRAEMVKMIGKGTAAAEYSDVDSSHWGYEYIKTSGVAADANGNFRPSEAMTRGDIIELLWQRAGAPAGSVAPDSVKAQHTNPEAAAWGYATGVMQGYEDGNMMYENGISRAEAAAVIVRSRGNAAPDYYTVKANNPDVFLNTYKNLTFLQDSTTYGAISSAAAKLGGIEKAATLIPEGHSEDETASMAAAAQILSTAAKRLNKNVPAFTEGAYLTVPLDGDADSERIGAVLYMIDQAAPLGIKCAADGSTEAAHIKTSSSPADSNNFAYRLEEVPDEVYAASLGEGAGSPVDNFKFAMDFAGLFTTVTSKCEKIVKEQYGADMKVTFYPSLSWKTSNTYKYRVKCEMVSANGKELVYKDVLGGESTEVLKDGMTFWADIESDHAFGMGIGAIFNFSDPVYIENK